MSEFEDGLPPEAKQFFDFLKNSSAQARSDQIGGSRMGLASQIFFMLADRYIVSCKTPKFRPEIAGLAVMYADALILALKTPPEMMK
jgi:hypothetical protein